MRAAAWGRLWAAGVWACVAVGGPSVAWAADPAPPAVQAMDYARWDEIADVVVSPSGKRMAFLLTADDGFRRLGVIDLDPIGNLRAPGGFANADVTDIRWVNDDRLVFEAYARGPIINVDGGGTFAVNHDGSDIRRLISARYELDDNRSAASRIKQRTLAFDWSTGRTFDDGGADVLAYKARRDGVGDFKELQLARLDTTNGRLTNYSADMPEGARQWLLDPKGEPRVVRSYVDGKERIHWRRPGTETWTVVAEFESYGKGSFSPWLLESPTRLLVRSRPSHGTTALYAFDLEKGQRDPEPLMQVKGFDLRPVGELDSRTGRLLGVHFTADRPMSYWFDEGMAKLQRSIDEALPGRSNRLYCGRCTESRFFVVRSSSDRHPGEFLLFDREKLTLQTIGAARPQIRPDSQGARQLQYLNARDGLSLPVYVTRPATAPAGARLPGVVLVHGGPWVRGADLGWDADAQFLASMGYVVLQPEFRGSEGYGRDLYRAGWKEWGFKMQDDLADTVAWAAQQGLLDASKVCVVGGSYGGYAALMAPIATPGVFRCAAAFAAPTDIGQIYDIHWSDFSEDSRRYDLPVLVGDRDKDAERLQQASPLKRVAEIKVPVLLAHGAQDRRVPIAHANAFAAAARDAGIDLTVQLYPEDGHGFYWPSHEADYYNRLAAFLAKSLAGAPAPAADQNKK